MWELLKRPSGFVPVLISAGFLATLLTGLAQGTLVRQPDEGTAAHLFQLLMPVQFLIIIFFAVSWLPKKTIAALEVLSLQCAAALAVFAIVYFKHL
jgi:amino acid permease